MSESEGLNQGTLPGRFLLVDTDALLRPIADLAALHEEAEENARLAALLSGAGRLAPTLGGLAVVLGWFGRMGHGATAIWLALVLSGAGSMYYAFRLTAAGPFSAHRLRAFAREMGGILLFCGFGWGAGAFLLVSPQASVVTALALMVVAALAVVFLLREGEAVFSFLLPSVTLCAFASILHPFAEGTLGAVLVLVTGAALCLLARLRHVRAVKALDAPPLPSFK
jgi:hypothetical protein